MSAKKIGERKKEMSLAQEHGAEGRREDPENGERFEERDRSPMEVADDGLEHGLRRLLLGGRPLRPLVATPMVTLFKRSLEPFYSSRNVLAGSIFAIRRVGRVVARSVTNTSVRTTVVRVGTS